MMFEPFRCELQLERNPEMDWFAWPLATPEIAVAFPRHDIASHALCTPRITTMNKYVDVLASPMAFAKRGVHPRCGSGPPTCRTQIGPPPSGSAGGEDNETGVLSRRTGRTCMEWSQQLGPGCPNNQYVAQAFLPCRQDARRQMDAQQSNDDNHHMSELGDPTRQPQALGRRSNDTGVSPAVGPDNRNPRDTWTDGKKVGRPDLLTPCPSLIWT